MEQNKVSTTKIEGLYQKIESYAKVERILAIVLIAIPLILRLADDQDSFRISISNYAYMTHNYWFGSLLTLAAAMFIFNGATHINGLRGTIGKGYNIILGGALLGIVYFPHLDYKFIHYTFAIIFFLGSAFVIAFVTENKKHRLTCKILAAGVILPLILYFVPGMESSLLFAEWISLFFIALHFFLESKSNITL